MKGLYKVLPPFAPDYSGVCSVLFELGGIVVIHDGGGCTGNFTGYDEPRWYGSSSAVFSSELREIEAIVGDDEKLLCKLEDAVHTLGRRFVAIVGSPAPMVIGTDYRAIAHILSRRIGIEVLIFDTNGIKYYDDGASMAFSELARRFVKPASTIVEYGVNIIGATPLDIGNGQQASRLRALLADAGCRVVSCWAMGSTLDDIAQSAQARLNIVVSRAGLEAARYMECEHGIPYLIGIPIGRGPRRRFIGSVRSLLGLDSESGTPEKPVAPAAPVDDVLVIGEQVLSNAVRDCLRMDLGLDKVTVASFFGMDPALMEEDDIGLECEETLTAITRKHQYDIIVGDPLYRDLVAPSRMCHFIGLPHIALSSRLFWDSDFDCIGMEGAHYFEKKLKQIKK
jgi:nitrogenase molybdenum-cofactor synthesis protein NifE